jgi:nickel-dependent lactate racemase
MPWYGDTELALEFPDSWQVNTCRMEGQDTPKIGDKEIRAAFQNPIGTPRIAELAKGKKDVVIIFDDLTRPTKTDVLIPYVLEELKEGGIKDEGIRFISAIGAHGVMRMMDYAKKLGLEVVQKYPVYNHNPYENCTYLGKTARGIEVSVNSEFMACDLKIAVGGVVPHPTAGFGGGGKMVLPGVCSIDTINANHGGLGEMSEDHNIVLNAWGNVEDNRMRLDIEEIARMAGLDFSVNAVMNLHRDTIGLFAGDLVEAHREAVKLARKVYTTPVPEAADVVVSNAYGKANEAAIAVETGRKLLKEEGGDLVVTCNIPEGQICHYLARSFGKTIGGRLYGQRKSLPERVKRMIAMGPYMDRAGLDWMGPQDQIIIINSWQEIIDLLKKSHGDGTKVSVIPDATIQYFPQLERGETEIFPAD